MGYIAAAPKQGKRQKRFSAKFLAGVVKKRHQTRDLRKSKAKREKKRKIRDEAAKHGEEDAHQQTIKKLKRGNQDFFDEDAEDTKSKASTWAGDPFEDPLFLDEEMSEDQSDSGDEAGWPDEASDVGDEPQDESEGEGDDQPTTGKAKPARKPIQTSHKTLAREEEKVQEAEDEIAETGGEKIITSEMFDDWMETKQLRLLVVAYCTAVQHIVSDGKAETPVGFDPDGSLSPNKVVMTVLKYCVELFDFRLGRTSKKKRNLEPATLAEWNKYKLFIRRFLRHTFKFLNFLSASGDSTGTENEDGALTTADKISFVLKNCVELAPYLTTFIPVARIYLKTLLALVIHSNDYVRLTAFVNIQALAKHIPYPFVELCMKGLYLTFFRNSRAFNAANAPLILRLMEFVVSLYGMDLVVAYQQGFVYIRQMALWLRNAMQHPCEENYQPIYSWQYVNSLRLLGLVIMKYNGANQLGALVYPWVQLACGVLELFPAPKCFTLHLQVLSLLNRMSAKTQQYIPVSSYLLRIIQSAEYAKAYPQSVQDAQQPAPDLTFMIKVKKSKVKDFSYLTAVFREATFLLIEHLAQWSHTIAYPELAHLSISVLRKMRKKQIQVSAWNNLIRDAIAEIDQNTEWVAERRKDVNFSPIDISKIRVWENETKQKNPPLVHYCDSLREKRLQAIRAARGQPVKKEDKPEKTTTTTTAKKVQPQGGQRVVLEDVMKKAARREFTAMKKSQKRKEANERRKAAERGEDVDSEDDPDAYGVDYDPPEDDSDDMEVEPVRRKRAGKGKKVVKKVSKRKKQ